MAPGPFSPWCTQRRRQLRSRGPSTSPCDRPLLRRVHVLFRSGLEEKRFHVLGKEAARLRIHQIQTVVVDQHHLLARPLSPAVLADLSRDALANRPWERWALE